MSDSRAIVEKFKQTFPSYTKSWLEFIDDSNDNPDQIYNIEYLNQLILQFKAIDDFTKNIIGSGTRIHLSYQRDICEFIASFYKKVLLYFGISCDVLTQNGYNKEGDELALDNSTDSLSPMKNTLVNLINLLKKSSDEKISIEKLIRNNLEIKLKMTIPEPEKSRVKSTVIPSSAHMSLKKPITINATISSLS